MKRPTRPRPLSQRAPLEVLTRTWFDIPLPAPFVPEIIVPPLPIVRQPTTAASSVRPRKKRRASTK